MGNTHSKPEHDYHLVDPSPWPLLSSLGALVMAIGAICWMRSIQGDVLFGVNGPWLFILGSMAVVACAFFWWRDVIRESHKGDHTPVVQIHLRYGMILFIASEVMFFVAWFWAYFDASLYPAGVQILQNNTAQIGLTQRNEVLGGQWPPVPNEAFKHTFSPWGLPLTNTLILLLSGVTVTWAHHALLKDDRRGLIAGLVCTVLLGALFSYFQYVEYGHAAFNYSGHIYGATFFMATGFHGAHVLIGTIFLAVCLIRALSGDFTKEKHFGFEAAAWYWHFVDVVWLFLFACIYVWGAGNAVAGH
ncbi:MAG: cytochrome c oxidase subunit 3 [Verrucomicrobiae bacterium]|nr:cytochrome c oxidase subunit 3 [Verrucomicrobiae bacterium]